MYQQLGEMLRGKNILLRNLSIEDASTDYLSWLNDYETVKYTESRHTIHTMESLKNFIAHVNNDSNYCFAITDIQSGKHVGNIKIGNIHPIYKYADVGLIIGDKNYWGKGIATEAIRLCVDYAFKQLKLHRLYAGIYDLNIGSIKAFEKAGFVREGCEKEKYLFEGKRIDSYVYGIVNESVE
ncbi:MAG: GNAT family N-acetyltransferase [Tannerella sp.]|nr:GNAT family N-acetyltransferase [Tannerella sp.]